MRQAASASACVEGGTAYVTLEPCAHHGRTPPCCDALIAAGIGRVVVGAVDPDSRTAGKGVARLRAHLGDASVVVGEVEPSLARAVNAPFFHRIRSGGRPYGVHLSRGGKSTGTGTPSLGISCRSHKCDAVVVEGKMGHAALRELAAARRSAGLTRTGKAELHVVLCRSRMEAGEVASRVASDDEGGLHLPHSESARETTLAVHLDLAATGEEDASSEREPPRQKNGVLVVRGGIDAVASMLSARGALAVLWCVDRPELVRQLATGKLVQEAHIAGDDDCPGNVLPSEEQGGGGAWQRALTWIESRFDR